MGKILEVLVFKLFFRFLCLEFSCFFMKMSIRQAWYSSSLLVAYVPCYLSNRGCQSVLLWSREVCFVARLAVTTTLLIAVGQNHVDGDWRRVVNVIVQTFRIQIKTQSLLLALITSCQEIVEPRQSNVSGFYLATHACTMYEAVLTVCLVPCWLSRAAAILPFQAKNIRWGQNLFGKWSAPGSLPRPNFWPAIQNA